MVFTGRQGRVSRLRIGYSWNNFSRLCSIGTTSSPLVSGPGVIRAGG